MDDLERVTLKYCPDCTLEFSAQDSHFLKRKKITHDICQKHEIFDCLRRPPTLNKAYDKSCKVGQTYFATFGSFFSPPHFTKLAKQRIAIIVNKRKIIGICAPEKPSEIVD